MSEGIENKTKSSHMSRPSHLRYLVVVQCRFNSERLPGKAMLPLCGIPMLSFLLRRLKSGLPLDIFNIIVATTQNREDDIIESWALYENVEVIRGENEDVLKRFIKCLRSNPSNIVVRVTADNPLTCTKIIQNCVNFLEKNNLEYVQSHNQPYGTGVDVFLSDLLFLIDTLAVDSFEREHINAFVLKNPERFKIQPYNVEREMARPDLRMTVDSREDWEKINELFVTEDIEPWRISLAEAIKRMDPSSI